MTLTLSSAIAKVNQIFSGYVSATPQSSPLVPAGWFEGKVYEAWVLTVMLERFRTLENYQVTLIGGPKVHLESGGGPINISYPRFELTRPGAPAFDIWTDIEFSTICFAMAYAHGTGVPGKPHRHELDIVVVPSGTSGYPAYDEIAVGVGARTLLFIRAWRAQLLAFAAS